MTTKQIVVIGATGSQGGSVIETFLKEPGWRVRGLTRNTDGPASQALKARGVDMVYADLDDVSTLVKAFEGTNAIFSMTDFWTGFFNPANQTKLSPGQDMIEWAHDNDVQQGKNVFAAAAQTQDLEKLVCSSLSYATKWSGGKYKHAYHYDAGARAVEYAREHHPDTMSKTSVIQLGMFLSNMLVMPWYQPKKDKDNVYTFGAPLPADLKIPLIATKEDTGLLVKTLIESEPGKNLLAYRESMTLSDFAETWGSVLGVKTNYVPVDLGKEWGLSPAELKRDIEEAMAYVTEFGFDGGDPSVIHPKDLKNSPKLGTVADWIKGQDWSAVM